MTDTRKVQLESAVDPSGAKTGFDQIKHDAHVMARAVAQAGGEAGAGLEKVGAGGAAAAAKVDSSTRSIVASIQRTTAATEAGGRGTAAYFEAIAKQRGISTDALKPYLDQLRAAEAAQARAAGGIDKMGISAAQTTAALRGIPAQFTDIVTSLTAGQNPMQVFLQQGGQLKDMFGGAGNAARALGGYVAGLVSPLTLTAGAVAALAAGYALGAAETSGFTRALVLSGNQAGATTQQLHAAAAAAAELSGGSQRRAAEVLTEIAGSGDVAATNLARFTAAAIALERAGGPAAEETAKALASLAREPLAGALKLNEATGFLTRSTYEHIKSLSEQGRTVDAARVAQVAYAEALEQRAPQILEQLGYVERAWQKIKDLTAGAVSALASVGRPADTIGREIEALEARIASNNRDIATGGQTAREASERGNAILTQRLRILQQAAGFEALSATYQAQAQEQIRARADFDKQGLQYLDTRAKAERDITQIRELGARAGATEVEIERRIAEYRAKAFSSDNKSAARDLQQQVSLLNELSGLSSSYAQDLQRLNAARAAGLVNDERYGELLRELVSRQPFAKKAAEEIADAVKKEADATAAAVRERERYLGTLAKDNDAGERSLDQLRDELVLLTAGKEAVRARVALRIEEQIQQLEIQAIRQADRNLDEEAAEALRERIRQLRQELALRSGIDKATDAKEAADATHKAGEASLQEWKRINDQIGQSLTDAIMEGGKSGADLLKDYFRTLVLRPIVQAIVQPVSNAVLQMFGMGAAGGVGGATGGAGPYGQLISQAGNWAMDLYRQYAGSTAGLATGATNAALIESASGTAGYGASSASGTAASSALNSAGFWGMVASAFVGVLNASTKDYERGWNTESMPGWAMNGKWNAAYDFWDKVGISDKWAQILSGQTLFARAIGRKAPEVQQQGVTGSFGGGDFSGQMFADWRAKGGWFRSDKTGTNFAALDEDLGAVLDSGSKATLAQVERYAEVLGLPAERLSQITSQARVVLTGNAEQDQKAILEAIGQYSKVLSESFTTALTPFKRAGEDVEETLARLATLQTFSENLNDLGGVFSKVAGLGIDAREALIEMAGGMDVLQQQAQGFVQNYYGRDEIAGLKARELQDVMRGLGITQDVNTKDQFRALVEGTDVSTTAGQERLVTLLQASQEFAQVAEYLSETGKSLAETAAQAPLVPALEKLFQGEGMRQQIDAINGVTAAVQAVQAAVESLTEAVLSPVYEYREVSTGP